MSVNCGNRRRHADGGPAAHASIDAVRACCLAEETWFCDWQTAHNHPEDGEQYVLECGGLAWSLPGDRGYTCEHGHDHIYADVCDREGWGYVADPEEAGLLAGRGVQPVAMNGGGIEIDSAAMHYAASLPG
jgi:hypothetical protein